MGGGSWTTKNFVSYSTLRGRTVSLDGSISGDHSTENMFSQFNIHNDLKPYHVTRECCDSKEHPNTIPVILALDVTGSMGRGAVEVAKKLNVIMTDLYTRIKDVEFMIMGIGDMMYDHAPLQVSQFESDIRIADQLEKIYFEGNGGGNGYESYSLAWYFALYHTKLDCWKRGKKGIIITMGDEAMNPYIPLKGRHSSISYCIGDNLESDINTVDLYNAASEKFDIYHLAVNDKSTSYKFYSESINNSFGRILDNKHFRVVTIDSLASEIVDVIVNSESNSQVDTSMDGSNNNVNEIGEIIW